MVRVKRRLAILSRSTVDLSAVSLSPLPFSYQLPDELWHFPSLSWHKLLQLSLSDAVAFENRKIKTKGQASPSQDLTTRVIIQYFFPSPKWLKDEHACSDSAVKFSALVAWKFVGRLTERCTDVETSIKMRFFSSTQTFSSSLSKSGNFLPTTPTSRELSSSLNSIRLPELGRIFFVIKLNRIILKSFRQTKQKLWCCLLAGNRVLVLCIAY